MLKCLFALLISVAAFAYTPQDVTNAVVAGNIPQAEVMVRSVLKEHPDNPKAHYYYAQILNMENNKPQAKMELQSAINLAQAQNTTFTTPQKLAEFQTALNTPVQHIVVTQTHTTATTQNVQRNNVAVVQNNDATDFLAFCFWLILGGLILWAIYALYKFITRPVVVNLPTPKYYPPVIEHVYYYDADQDRSTRAVYPEQDLKIRVAPSPTYSAPVQAPTYAAAPTVVHTNNSGNDMLTGMLVGNMMAHQGDGGYRHSRGYDYDDTPRHSSSSNDSFTTSYSSSSSDSYSSSSSFDTGSSWDSGSSSSFDSGSSSDW